MPDPWYGNNIVSGYISKKDGEIPLLGQYYNATADRYTDPFVNTILDYANRGSKKKPRIDIDGMINRLANENNVKREEIIQALRADSRLKGDPEGAFGDGELDRVRSGSADW